MEKIIEIRKDQLPSALNGLNKFKDKNPVSLEISRLIRKITKEVFLFKGSLEDVFDLYVVRDQEGKLKLSEETLEALKENPNLQPSVYGYMVKEGEEKKYHKALFEKMQEKSKIKTNPVNINKQKVRLESGDIVLFSECISDYFTSGQIMFLEDMGILVDLD